MQSHFEVNFKDVAQNALLLTGFHMSPQAVYKGTHVKCIAGTHSPFPLPGPAHLIPEGLFKCNRGFQVYCP